MKNSAYVVLSVVLLLTLFITGQAPAQENQTYKDAKSMYGSYKRNQAQIESLNRSIAAHQTAIRGFSRDAASAAYGYGSFRAGQEYTADIAAHREAMEREQRTLNLLQRRQAIIETSWERNGHISGYFGPLKDTYGRTIYDHKTRKDVNLMDFRMDSFRNPNDGHPHPSGVRSTRQGDPSSIRSSTTRTSHPTSRNSKSSTRNDASTRSSGSTKSKSSSTSRSSGSSGGTTHTMTLTPVN